PEFASIRIWRTAARHRRLDRRVSAPTAGAVGTGQRRRRPRVAEGSAAAAGGRIRRHAVRRQVLSLGARLFERFTDRIPAAPRTAIVRKLMARLPPDQQYRLGVASMAGSLVNLSRNGYHPDLIVDVGAHKGDWTRLAADVFR